MLLARIDHCPSLVSFGSRAEVLLCTDTQDEGLRPTVIGSRLEKRAIMTVEADMTVEAEVSKPIYLLVLAKGYTEAWYQLSKEEQDELWRKARAIDDQAGATWQLVCDSRWADESMPLWGVIEYPDMEAYQRKVAALEEMDWWRYVSTKTVLGTKVEE